MLAPLFRIGLTFIILCACVRCLVIRLIQDGRTSVLNYSRHGLSINLREKEKCMPEIGCFSAGPPFFDPVHRPVSLLPQNRDAVATSFLLYTRRNPSHFQSLRSGELSSFLRSNFLLRTETKIIVPGWMDSLKASSWMQDMKDALLTYDDCNVIIVDWSKTNGIPFALAVANTRVVGAEIALLVNFIQDAFEVPPQSVHVIGHSLGTEIAGYAGKRIVNLGRITALDPAGPYFRKVSPEVNLDPSDAVFVDAIHAGSSDDPDSPSRFEQTGHVDFYPNGGEVQPGCPNPVVDTFLQRGVLEGARNLLVCDHYRVIDFFLATIPNHYGCRPVGVACDSWHSFEHGMCSDCGYDGSNCAIMGFQADEQEEMILKYPPRKFFLYTSKFPPFCVQQYHITVKLGSLGSSQSRMGDLFVTLKGRYGTTTAHVNKWSKDIRPGGEYRTIATSDENIEVHTVIFRWTCGSTKLRENIVVTIKEEERCILYLQNIKVVTFSATNPRQQVVVCGSKYPITQNVDLILNEYTYC